MNDKKCFFIGNRHAPSSIKEHLIEVVERHIIEYGVNTFAVGCYGNFDNIVQSVLREAKNQHSDIKIYLLSPYALNRRIEVPKNFDGILYPNGLETVPKPYAIVYANKYMVQNSDYLITYCHNIGNTRNIVEYAKRREKKGLIMVTLL